jgi:hypothetical protein
MGREVRRSRGVDMWCCLSMLPDYHRAADVVRS